MKGRQTQAGALRQLTEAGYCVLPGLLDAPLLARLRGAFEAQELSRAPRDTFGESGAFVKVDYTHPLLGTLLSWPPTLAVLSSMGFPEPKLHSFYISTKPPAAAALPWHSDLFYRYDRPEPAELFLIYYLEDTSPQNGCLRVVPGSHRWPHAKRHAQPEGAERRVDEVDVPIRAGDLFIGDRRILHATHANHTDSWRTCITIAYAPAFNGLPEPIRALIVRNPCLPPAGWWDHKKTTVPAVLRAVLPVYRGTATPVTIEY